jgi:hypothetical protein
VLIPLWRRFPLKTPPPRGRLSAKKQDYDGLWKFLWKILEQDAIQPGVLPSLRFLSAKNHLIYIEFSGLYVHRGDTLVGNPLTNNYLPFPQIRMNSQ